MSKEKFVRIEKKFRLSEEQLKELKPLFQEHMKADQYGRSQIMNIYYDTDDYYLIRRSIEGPAFKEKLRVRSYSGFNKDSEVFVELKRKASGIGYKRRICTSVPQAMQLLRGNEISADDPQIENEILQFVKRYQPHPKIFLSYDRIAMCGRDDPSLRITIDRNIRFKMYADEISFDLSGTPVISDGADLLMEIKTAGSMPEWLIKSLSAGGIYQASFSKIGACFSQYVLPTLTERRDLNK